MDSFSARVSIPNWSIAIVDDSSILESKGRLLRHKFIFRETTRSTTCKAFFATKLQSNLPLHISRRKAETGGKRMEEKGDGEKRGKKGR